MRARLGYVAISLTLDEIDHYQTITWTRFSQLSTENKENKIASIIKYNLNFLKDILMYNIENEIFFYRMSHHMIPLTTHPLYSYDYITPYQKEFSLLSKLIKENNIRIDIHPDQFCVLNSLNERVVEQTIKELEFCFKVYQALDMKGYVILHVGSSRPNKIDAIHRFENVFKSLPKNIQEMILLENDDKVYTANDVLELCERLEIPMVLDYHHSLCNKGNTKLEAILPRILKTWSHVSIPPKMHFSSPKSPKEKRSHSVYLSYHGFLKFLNLITPYFEEVDIMLECKGKDEALFRLIRQLKFSKQYIFINNSTFVVEDKN